jgi:hypothetical protein
VAIDVNARLSGGLERFTTKGTDFVKGAAIGVATNDGEWLAPSDAAKFDLLRPVPRCGEGGRKRSVRNPTVIDRNEIV